ncbi:MAG: NAD(P)-dependent oxidoreductase [Arenicellales bacterium]|nr:NAD(P)-dependent oxidoreductase [Arenicellales bacterium]
MKTVLMTGAKGGIGTFLRKELKGKYAFRLSDLGDVADLAANETSVPADLSDFEAVRQAVKGVEGVIHLGAFSVEGSWQTIQEANIIGTYNLYQAAHEAGVKRIVFASSNHAVGFYARSDTIDHSVYPKPDTRYGVSKVFGESLASLYADKYGIESLCIRIGNVADRPVDHRRLAIWISPRDMAQLTELGLEHPAIRFEIVYGMSDNVPHAWWDNSNAYRLGYVPMDRSDDFTEEVFKNCPEDTGDPRADHYQGGSFVSTESGGDPTKPDME